MTRRSTPVLLVLLLVLGAAGAVRGDGRDEAPAAARPTPGGRAAGEVNKSTGRPWRDARPPTHGGEPRSLSSDPYVSLAHQLHRRGVRVWFETDLVKSWLAGQESFRHTLKRLRKLARIHGVVGFKIADELGYEDGLTSMRRTRHFLRQSRRALHRVAPHARILVDVVVPELGCLRWLGGSVQQVCANEARADYPAVSVKAVSRYVRAGLVDAVNVSTGLLEPDVYAQWGLTLDRAQRLAWRHVRHLRWGRHVTVHARKALAEPGGYAGSATQAAADVRTYVTIPVRHGARAVDLWTWRQPYDGDMVSLLPTDLHTTPLWVELRRQRRNGVHLTTHMTPSAMPQDRAARGRECSLAAEVFSAVLVAAGTG